MSRRLVTFPPTRIDLAISKSCARAATPGREHSLQVMTWLADEKILLGVVGLFWLNAYLRPHREAVRHEPVACCSAWRLPASCPMCSSTSSTANDRIEAWCTADGTESRGPEMHGTPFHPDMRSILALLPEPWPGSAPNVSGLCSGLAS